MAGVRQILKYQWKAYWRRFVRGRQLVELDAFLLLLFGVLFIRFLPPAMRQMAAGRTAGTELFLFVLSIAWFYPLIEDSRISIHPKDLIRFPLTTNSLLWIRIASFFISPAAMIITVGSLLSALPLLKSPRPFIGIGAAILLFVLAANLGLSLSHMISSAALRRRLVVAAAIVIVPLGAVLFASGRDAPRLLGVMASFTPVHLVARTAMTPDYLPALISIMALTACAALAILLLRWSFNRSLSDQEVIRPPDNLVASLIRLPGRLSGLVRKEQNYFRKLPGVWMGLLFTLAYSQIFWLGAPPPVSYQAIILILISTNMGLSSNSFGLDAPSEINRYLLFPLRGRDILLSKNLGFAVIIAAQLSVTLPFALWRLGWQEVSFGLIEAAALSLAYLAWGNLVSVSMPFKMRFYHPTSGGSLIVAIACQVICSIPGVLIIYLTRFNSNLLAAKLVAVLSLTALAYLASLHFAGRKFERDWQRISYRLS